MRASGVAIISVGDLLSCDQVQALLAGLRGSPRNSSPKGHGEEPSSGKMGRSQSYLPPSTEINASLF